MFSIANAAAAGEKGKAPASAPKVEHTRAPLEIKTLKIGMSQADVVRLFPEARCYSSNSCSVDTRLAGESASFQVSFTDDKLDNAYLSKYETSDVDVVADAFRQKYGPPDSTTTRMLQNGLGNKFECPVYVWNFPDGVLMVAKYRPEILTLMQVEMTSTDRINREKTKRKEAAGDI